MSTEVVTTYKFRSEVPPRHRTSLDTRLQWLWNQRLGTVQTVWQKSPDLEDKIAATIILQAILTNDLNAIALLFHRLEGGVVTDEETLREVQPL